MAPSLQTFETTYLALSTHLRYILKESSWAEYILFHLVIGLLGLAINAFMGSQKRGTYYLGRSAIAEKQMKAKKEREKVEGVQKEKKNDGLREESSRGLGQIKNEVAKQSNEARQRKY